METREEGTDVPSGLQQPVGTAESVPVVLGHALALPTEERISLLKAMCARTLPRLEEGDRLLSELRAVRQERKLTSPVDAQARIGLDEVLAAVLRQSMGAQRDLFHLLATRTLAALTSPERVRLIDAFAEIVRAAPSGAELPTVH